MRRLLFVSVLCTAAALSAVAERADATSSPGDPLHSAECRQALESLQARENEAAASPASAPTGAWRERRPDAALEASRRRAAGACLASRADPEPPPRQPYASPVVVAPVAVARRHDHAGAALHAAPLPGPPVKPAGPPPVIESCDASGCWASDGSHLNRMGPNLWGPHGVCTLQGNILQCP